MTTNETATLGCPVGRLQYRLNAACVAVHRVDGSLACLTHGLLCGVQVRRSGQAELHDMPGSHRDRCMVGMAHGQVRATRSIELL